MIPISSVVLVVAFIGLRLLYTGQAATFATSKEAENGTIAGNAVVKNGPNASNGQFVKFGGGSKYCAPTAAIPAANCRPLIGAVAGQNPGTPTEIANGTAPSTDKDVQYTYFEKLSGQTSDVYRSYHSFPTDDTCASGNCTTGNADVPVNAEEQKYASEGKVLDINWSVANKYADAESLADGGTQYIHDNIVQAAKNLVSLQKQYPDVKVFFSPWHETQLGVSKTDPEDPAGCTPGSSHDYGSPDQFKKAWINIHSIFVSQGVTNVIWTLNYASYKPRDCFVPLLWPGNQYVDWIIYDTYDHGNGNTYASTLGRFYDVLKADSTATDDFNSKPWGIGEFGTCGDTDAANARQYYADAKTAFDDGTHPKLDMYLVFAENGAPGAGYGCLTDYHPDTTNPGTNPEIYDAQRQTIFNAFWADLTGN